MVKPGTQPPVHGLPVRSAPALDLLAGTKVLDLTSSIAGPYAGQLLADMGATVVKVEKPRTGDDARAWGPPFLYDESLWFMSVNRAKLSVTLDFSTPEGLELLRRLIPQCDVLLVNLVARAQRKLGIDAASLRVLNPQLVHTSVTGFGLTGARADMACYDLIAEGYSGVMDLTGEPDSPPQKVGAPAADMLAGHDAAMAVLAALLRRGRTGVGCDIDVSMVQSMSRFMTTRLTTYLGSGQLSSRSGGRDSVIAIYQVFDTADEPMTLGLGNDAIWRRFWDALGMPEMANNPATASNVQRRANRADIVAAIADIISRKPRAYWLELFAEARIPAGPIYRMDELATDEPLRKEGFLYQSAGSPGPVPHVGLGIRFDGKSEGTAVAPKLGQQTNEVLGNWLGCSASELQRLRDQGVI
jgi:crotonobetainyl-CoA:carnitine CoA-transferase CaiB-like acyl-CoA transferase